MVAKYYFQQSSLKSNRTRRYKLRNKKKILDWLHIKKRGCRDIKSCPILEPSRKQEERKSEKQLEKIGNQGSG